MRTNKNKPTNLVSIGVVKVIEVNVTLSDGTNREISIPSKSKVVDLTKKSIIAIDLTELDQLSDLEELILCGNRLMTIDLTVLAFCASITLIGLANVGESAEIESLSLQYNSSPTAAISLVMSIPCWI